MARAAWNASGSDFARNHWSPWCRRRLRPTRRTRSTRTTARPLPPWPRLRADDQELLRLVAWEEFSHSQIAMVLGISVNAVAIRVHRARGRFVQALEEEGRKGSGPSRTPGPVKGRTFGRIRREQME
ncbi:MAG: sigma-70 region 4 domain-containing protein [Candidatus Limnocylindrales bacterium]